MRFAVLDGLDVVNVVLWDGESPLEGSDALVACPPEVSVGWRLVGEQWEAPQEPSQPDPVGADPALASALAKIADVAGLDEAEVAAAFGPQQDTIAPLAQGERALRKVAASEVLTEDELAALGGP